MMMEDFIQKKLNLFLLLSRLFLSLVFSSSNTCPSVGLFEFIWSGWWCPVSVSEVWHWGLSNWSVWLTRVMSSPPSPGCCPLPGRGTRSEPRDETTRNQVTYTDLSVAFSALLRQMWLNSFLSKACHPQMPLPWCVPICPLCSRYLWVQRPCCVFLQLRLELDKRLVGHPQMVKDNKVYFALSSLRKGTRNWVAVFPRQMPCSGSVWTISFVSTSTAISPYATTWHLVEEWMDGWIDRQTERWTDRWTDEWMDLKWLA